MRHFTTTAAVLLVYASLFTSLAVAQDGDETLQDEARSLFEAGRTAFEAGRFEAALGYFQQSYDLSGRTGLLFNIGTAADRLQENQRALDAYRAYLEASPEATNRPFVERRIAFLVARVGVGGDDPSDRTTRASSDPSGAGGTDAAPWVVLGGSALVAVVGGVLLGLGRADAATVENAEIGASWEDFAGAADRAPSLSIAGWVLMGIGVAGMASALVWALVGSSDGEAELAVGPGGVQLRGQF